MLESWLKKTILLMDKIVSVIMLLVAIRLVVYMVTQLLEMADNILAGDAWMSGHDGEILGWIVSYIVMVKAYKVLASYTLHQHINIRYVTELVIISCFVEFIFKEHLGLGFRAVLGAVGLISLGLYLYFYQTLKKIEE